jgi:thymidylate kinase
MVPNSPQGWPDGVTVIAIEGIDGSGKSTLVDGLRTDPRLGRAFAKVSSVPEFSSPIGHCLRENLNAMSPVSIAYAFAAERHWLVERCDPTVDGLVIWDRYIDSAYACRSADVMAGRAPLQLMDVVREIVERMPQPTITLHVDTSVPTAFARLVLRQQLLSSPIRNDERLLEFQREAYQQLWRERKPPPRRLDGEASRSLLVEQAVDEILSSRQPVN